MSIFNKLLPDSPLYFWDKFARDFRPLRKQESGLVGVNKVTILLVRGRYSFLFQFIVILPAQGIYHHEHNFIKNWRWDILIDLVERRKPRKEWLIGEEPGGKGEDPHKDQEIGQQSGPAGLEETHDVHPRLRKFNL